MKYKTIIVSVLLVALILFVGFSMLPKNSLLITAIQQNDIKKVKRMLSLGADPNAYDGFNLRPLNLAVRKGNIEITKLLLEKGADPSLKGNLGDLVNKAHFSPLMDAILYQPNNIEFLRILIDAGADVNDESALHYAGQLNNIQAVELLLAAGANPTRILSSAVMYEQKHLVQLALNYGAEMNDVWIFGRDNPVIEETSNYPSDDKIIDGQIDNYSNNQDLFHSEEEIFSIIGEGDLNKVKGLIQSGVDANYHDEYGYSILMQSSGYGYVDIVEYLIHMGADVNLQDEYKSTALMSALHTEPSFKKTKEDVRSIVSLLLKAGANPNIADDFQGYTLTPLLKAVVDNYNESIELLLEYGADPNQYNHMKHTPLNYAAYYGNFQAAKLLLEAGADPDIADLDGKTPLDVAKEEGHHDFVKLLESYQ